MTGLVCYYCWPSSHYEPSTMMLSGMSHLLLTSSISWGFSSFRASISELWLLCYYYFTSQNNWWLLHRSPSLNKDIVLYCFFFLSDSSQRWTSSIRKREKSTVRIIVPRHCYSCCRKVCKSWNKTAISSWCDRTSYERHSLFRHPY